MSENDTENKYKYLYKYYSLMETFLQTNFGIVTETNSRK